MQKIRVLAWMLKMDAQAVAKLYARRGGLL